MEGDPKMVVNILVEGQTEEYFVKEILSNYFTPYEFYLSPKIITTKRIRNGADFKGGLSNSNFDLFISDLKRIIRSTPHGIVTTMIDYYGLPSRFPGYEQRLQFLQPIQKVEFLENQLFEFIGSPPNFLPFIQLHEFESFHFADKIGFCSILNPSEANIPELLKIIDAHPNPESINEHYLTAPSKRIISNYKSYDKIVEGNLILLEIGLDIIINKCPHFRDFIQKLLLRAA